MIFSVYLVPFVFAIACVVGVGIWAGVTQGRGKSGLFARNQVGLPKPIAHGMQWIMTILVAGAIFLKYAEAGQARNGLGFILLCFGMLGAVRFIWRRA